MDPRRKKSPTGSTLKVLEKHVYTILKNTRLAFEGRRILVAVSGGLDSVSLLMVLSHLRSRFRFNLTVVHVNHGVRGKEAHKDALFVKSLAKKLNHPFVLKSVRGLNPKSGENEMRKMRYKALFEVMKKTHAEYIALAHHADDLLETRLLRLLQGTGITGLKAMSVLSSEGLLRPFLGARRRDIEAFARESLLKWCSDATNLDTTKLRNWIRRNWLAILRRDHPEYVENLAVSLDRIVEQEAAALTPILVFENLGVSVPLARQVFLNLEGPELNAVLHSYLRHHLRKTRLTSHHVSEFKKRLSTSRKRFTFSLGGIDWIVELDEVRPSAG